MATKLNSRKPAAAKPAAPLSSRDNIERLTKLKLAAEAKGDGDLTVYAEAGEDGLVYLHHVDDLDRMLARLYGLEATISGMIEGDGDWGPGVLQLIQDVIEKMEKCVAAFEAVHKLREAKADKNAQQAA